MSFWRKPPREVYRVYGEDDFLSDEGIRPGECTVRPIEVDTSRVGEEGERSRRGARKSSVLGGVHEPPRRLRGAGVATLACLAVVTFVACALVLLHLSHAPSAKQSIAARQVSSHAERHAFAGEPATAPPKVHLPRQRHHKARVPNRRIVHPRRRRLRIATGHGEILKGEVLGPRASLPPVGHEFDFER